MPMPMRMCECINRSEEVYNFPFKFQLKTAVFVRKNELILKDVLKYHHWCYKMLN